MITVFVSYTMVFNGRAAVLITPWPKASEAGRKGDRAHRLHRPKRLRARPSCTHLPQTHKGQKGEVPTILKAARSKLVVQHE